MDEKEVRQQVTKKGEREKKRKFSPQSLIIKIIKSSKVTKKERKERGFTSLRLKHDTAKSREKKKRKKKKGRQN